MFNRREDENGITWEFDDDQGRIWEVRWDDGSRFQMGVAALPEPAGYYFESDGGERLFLRDPSPSYPQTNEDCRRLLREARERGRTW